MTTKTLASVSFTVPAELWERSQAMTDLEAKAREISKKADFILEGDLDEPLIVDTDILAHAILTALRSVQSETLERAAQVADEHCWPDDDCIDGTHKNSYTSAALDIAARIRALKDAP